jgi:hypothetical protein
LPWSRWCSWSKAAFEPLWPILLFPLVAAIFVAAGLLAWMRRPSNLLGPVLVAGGFVWLGAGLCNTGVKPLIATGLILQSVPLAVVVHLLHSFPSQRLRGRASQMTVAIAYLLALVPQACLASVSSRSRLGLTLPIRRRTLSFERPGGTLNHVEAKSSCKPGRAARGDRSRPGSTGHRERWVATHPDIEGRG